MKKIWLILLSLGFMMTAGLPAGAVDVKVSGEFYVAGMYVDKASYIKNYQDVSTAFYFQRLRVRTDFMVAPGLSLITRFDALERIWGGPRSIPGDSDYITYSGYYAYSAGTRAENENIAIDWAYIQYTSPIGTFTAGYQDDEVWGTVFGNSSIPRGKIGWSFEKGGWTALLQVVKTFDNSKSAIFPAATTDLDMDRYIAGVIYRWKSGEAGARYVYTRGAQFRNDSYPFASLIRLNSLQPYAKAKVGPVQIAAELDYYWGAEHGEDNGLYYDAKLEAINFYLDAAADFNMFYVGATFAYLSGDHAGTGDKKEGGSYLHFGGATGGGTDWNPCLIMFNSDRTYWMGGYGLMDYGPMENAWFGQVRGGIKPLPALDVMASVSYAQADQLPTTYLHKNYGTEIDLTATYKITNNLSYMLGFGYLITGDYYKFNSDSNELNNDYLVINKLTLTF